MATLVGMRIGTLRATVVGAVVIALSGCIGGDPLPTLPPTPTATPIFASEEEALAAAEEAYAAYLEVSSLIANEGGVDPERIAPFVTEEQLPDELAAAEYYRSSGLYVVGVPTATNFQLQRHTDTGESVEVVVYVCLDVSATRILDANGQDVTPVRREKGVLEVSLVGDSANDLLVDRSELWSESAGC